MGDAMDDAILRDIYGLAIKDQCFDLSMHVMSVYTKAVVLWCRSVMFCRLESRLLPRWRRGNAKGGWGDG